VIERQGEIEKLHKALLSNPVVCIVGARQVGKTTLARAYGEVCNQPVFYYDLENPEDMSRLADPMLALKNLQGLVVIDEIQQHPEIFRALRVLVDRPQSGLRFLVLGSASPNLLRQSSETLAGRIHYHQLGGFSLAEVGIQNHPQLWLRGGFPRAYLASSDTESHEWRRSFIQTFLERDLPQLGITIGAGTMRRFWTMIAHYHGQVWNASEFGRSFGVADTTIRHYLEMLTSALVVRLLAPWHENIKKRQVKAPKVYLLDSGLLHALLNMRLIRDIEGHPKVGASWEGFVLEQIVCRLGVGADECYFWATHGGAELDLLVVRGLERLGFEIKRTTSPNLTPSMRSALADLNLTRLDVIHAGDTTFPLDERVRAVALARLLDDLAPLGP
jgi:predicted AAA+ superfamily ATPase